MKYSFVLVLFFLVNAFAFAGRITIGDTVVYSQNGQKYRATVLAIYQNRTVRVVFPDGEFTESNVPVSTLSTPLAYLEGFQVGQEVVFSQNGQKYQALIEVLYEDRTAKVSFPNGEYTVSVVRLEALSITLEESEGFSVGQAVVYSQNGAKYDARIEAIYQDNSVKLSFPNGEYSASVVSIRTIQRILYQIDRFRINDDVVYSQNGHSYDARIEALYPDRTAKISFPNGEFSTSTIQLSTLSKKRFRMNGFRVDQLVLYGQNGQSYEARIIALYEDGYAKVDFPNGEFAVSQVPQTNLSGMITSIDR